MTAARRAAVALIGAAALAIPAVGAAAAPSATGSGQLSINTGSGWTHDPSTPLFDLTRIAPGWTGSADVAVRNDTAAAAAITLRTSDVVEDENGCNHPESFVDTTCTGDNAGELGKEIVLSVYADPQNDGTFDASPIWTGSIEDLTQGTMLASALSGGGTSTYRIRAELPSSSGNETQTDSVAFDMVVGLDGATVAVEGTKISRQTGGGLLNTIAGHLPFTGTPAMRLTAAGLSLLLAGAALMLALRQRRVGTV